MKIMKKFTFKHVLSALLCVVILTSALLFTGCGRPKYDKAEEDEQGLNFYLTADKSAYSVAALGTLTTNDVVIPAEFNGKPVTVLDFKSNIVSNLFTDTQISIPDSITMVGCEGNIAIIESYLEENGTSNIQEALGKYATYDKGSIYMGNESNPYLMLVYTNNESYSTPSGTKLIADTAFGESVRSISISDEVVFIHRGAFRFIECDTIQDEASGASIYNSVKISVDENNKNYKIANNMLVNKDATKVIYCTLDLITAVPETVEYFEMYAVTANNIATYRDALISMDMASADAPLYLPKGDNEQAVLLYAPEGSTVSDKVEIIASGALTDFYSEVTVPDSVIQIMPQAFSSTISSVTIGTKGWYNASKYADGFGYDLGYMDYPDDIKKLAKETKDWSSSTTAVMETTASLYQNWCRPID